MEFTIRHSIGFIIAVIIMILALVIIMAIGGRVSKKDSFRQDKLPRIDDKIWRSKISAPVPVIIDPNTPNALNYMLADAVLLPANNKLAAKLYLDEVYRTWDAEMWT